MLVFPIGIPFWYSLLSIWHCPSLSNSEGFMTLLNPVRNKCCILCGSAAGSFNSRSDSVFHQEPRIIIGNSI